jgi:hypothetical protein
LSISDAGGVFFFLNPKPKLNNMKQQAVTTSATNTDIDTALQAMGMYTKYINELQNDADKAFETLLALYVTPEAFAVIKRFQWALSDEYALGELLSMRDALNDLGEPDGYGVEVLQRILKAIKKERKAA